MFDRWVAYLSKNRSDETTEGLENIARDANLKMVVQEDTLDGYTNLSYNEKNRLLEGLLVFESINGRDTGEIRKCLELMKKPETVKDSHDKSKSISKSYRFYIPILSEVGDFLGLNLYDQASLWSQILKRHLASCATHIPVSK